MGQDKDEEVRGGWNNTELKTRGMYYAIELPILDTDKLLIMFELSNFRG